MKNVFPIIHSKNNKDDTKEITFNITFIGDTAVGKTSIIERYINDVFIEKHYETIDDEFKKKLSLTLGKTLQGKKYKRNYHIDLKIFDSSGNDSFKEIKRMNLIISDLIVICICDEEIEDNLKSSIKNINFINELKCGNNWSPPSIIIFKNKIDQYNFEYQRHNCQNLNFQNIYDDKTPKHHSQPLFNLYPMYYVSAKYSTIIGNIIYENVKQHIENNLNYFDYEFYNKGSILHDDNQQKKCCNML